MLQNFALNQRKALQIDHTPKTLAMNSISVVHFSMTRAGFKQEGRVILMGPKSRTK